MQITWIGHASFKIVTKDGFVIYIDPFAGDDSEYGQKANLVLVSHEGYHHMSYEKIKKISADETVILSTKQVAYEVGGTPMIAGSSVVVGEVKVKAVDAYSLRPGIGRGKGNSLGFMLSIENRIIYFAGSTDLIPEMREVFCDIALLPVAASRTMGSQQASLAAEMIKPRYAIPMHYGLHGGTVDDAEYFKELVEEKGRTQVIILKEGQSIEL